MSILRLFKAFPEKVSDMSKNDENEVGDVGCDQVEVRRFIHDGLRHRLTLGMSTNMSMTLIHQSTKLRILLCFLLPFMRVFRCRGRPGGFVLCARRRHADTWHRQRGRDGGSGSGSPVW